MYAWVFGINGKCIRGRTWAELFEVLDKVIDFYNINVKTKRLIVYVHNLSFEFQWFKDYFEWYKVFGLEERKPVYAITMSGIEFRCSYILSGYSLDNLGKNLTKYKVKKLKGDLDYRLLRHSNTPLTDKEWGYILNDALVVMSYIQEEIEAYGSITKLPLTKTGYVRMLCREKCLKGDNRFEYNKLIRGLTMTTEEYAQLKRAFSGGFTHANSNYVGKTLENIDSLDFTSSYPAVMLSEKFPMSKPITIATPDEETFIKVLNNFCCMFDITFYELEPIVDFENYISSSRCFELEHPIINNGRVVEASKVSLTMTEQDFFIISKMYKWEYMEVRNMKCFHKDYLPKDLILTILELYEKKTTLKGVVGREYDYQVSKGMINSCYGMCVTDPCRDEIGYSHCWLKDKPNIGEAIKKYNSDRQRFLYYAWGVWIPAYARRNLFTGILEFGEDYVYSDTDSVKVKNFENHKQYVENYNTTITNKIYKCLSRHDISLERAHPKTIKGVEKPLGVWDYEGRYDMFKTLGAKRYITASNGELSITIAGVNKTNGANYLIRTFGNLENVFNNFEEDLYFPSEYTYVDNGEEKEDSASGKLCHTYIDMPMNGVMIDYLGNKAEYYEKSGVHLEPTDYTMSLDSDFKQLLQGIWSSHIC